VVPVAFDDRSPIYRQIADRIEAEVLSGALAGDEQVMSTNKYAAFHRINPATVNKAFQQLVDDGILYKRRGIGMFVSRQARQTIRARRRKSFFTDVVDPMVAQAMAIGIELPELIDRITERAKENGR
jgi:DNA-binding transcriptional regulator YhcF (GntR family)